MLPPFDKHEYYRRAVQDPEATIGFLTSCYRETFSCSPRRFREDFCGTGALCAEWVKNDPSRNAVGIDKDARTLAYAKRHHGSTRLRWLRRDVLKASLPATDVACALNFSYCVFHTRRELRSYFVRCRKSLGKRGLLAIDCLPGIEVAGSVETEVHYEDFTYFWDQASFDPLSRRARFYIHFARPGESRRERQFSYDWRLWTVPELRDLLEECGFATTDIYYGGGDVEGSSGSMSILVVALTSRRPLRKTRRGNARRGGSKTSS